MNIIFWLEENGFALLEENGEHFYEFVVGEAKDIDVVVLQYFPEDDVFVFLDCGYVSYPSREEFIDIAKEYVK